MKVQLRATLAPGRITNLEYILQYNGALLKLPSLQRPKVPNSPTTRASPQLSTPTPTTPAPALEDELEAAVVGELFPPDEVGRGSELALVAAAVWTRVVPGIERLGVAL